MATVIQIATDKPITKFIASNIKDVYADGDIITFKYGGIYYTRFKILEDNEKDNISEMYKIIFAHVRKSILKSWLFDYERVKGLSFSINKPFYNDEESIARIAE